MPCWSRLLICSLALLAAACGKLPPPVAGGELVVAIRESPVFYQRTDGSESGFELDLLRAFAAHERLTLRLVPVADLQELHKALTKGRVHMAASAPLAGTELPAVSIRSAGLWVVGRTDRLSPDDVTELGGQAIEVVAGSPAGRALAGLPDGQRPQLTEHGQIGDLDLLGRVAEGKADLVATDEFHLDLATTFHPDLRPAFALPGRIEFGWLFAGEGATEWQGRASAFIAAARRDGSLARIHDRYFGHIKRINPVGVADFIEDIQTLLPKFRADFQRAQDVTGLDWRLLAALAYQESKWDPLATSPTGVRGIMMLTEDTADHLGVNNRLDAKESIRAGARYIIELMEQLPDEAKLPDRLWLTLAAYNLGMGHFNGARAIARGMKRDPNAWYEMKQVLPLLARPNVYARLKSGKARGGEAVIMVENVRTYYDILSRFEAPHVTRYGGVTLKPLVLR